jgi:hypothetical protein
MINAIKITYSNDGMWGSGDGHEYDVEASYEKYEEMATKILQEKWPGAEIELHNGIADVVEVHDTDTGWDRSGDEPENVALALHDMWESWDWTVEVEDNV